MQHYRLYVLDSLAESIENCIEIAAANDDDAIEQTDLLMGGWPCELWLTRRLVQGHRFSKH